MRIVPGKLLFEEGINGSKPEPFVKSDTVYFYENHLKSGKHLHFDVFSAVFYFISRYEEWQPFEADLHGRFEAPQSLLYKQKSHLKPVVDIWIMELRAALEQFYPDLKFPEKKYKVISTLDVDNLYAYKSKGLLRSAGACLKDLLRFDFKNLSERFSVLTGRKEDPFDIYQSVSEFCRNEQIPLFFFFLFRSGGRYDRTVSPASRAFQTVFKILMSNNAVIGIHPSYDSAYKENLLGTEVNDLSLSVGHKISFSRQHYLRFDIRTTPHLLLKSGIVADFSMGFASVPGFRAGTSFPFLYYDFNADKETELLFVPFCAMDGAYTVYKKTDPEEAFKSLVDLSDEVKKVGGVFATVFHERSFSDHLYNGFGALYKKLHKKL